MSITFYIIFFGFIAAYLYITLNMARNAPTLGDFYNMNQGAGPFLIAGTYAATWISAFGMIGVAGTSYNIAPLSGILMWGAMLGFIITGFFVGPRLRRFGQVTLGDFFGDRFDSDNVRILSTIVVIVGLTTYFVTQTIGSAVVTNMIFGLNYNLMVIVMSIIFIIIALTAGSKSVTITDAIMLGVIVMALGYIFSTVLLGKIGITRISAYAQENPSYFTFGGDGKILFTTVIGWQIIWALGNASMPQAVTRCYLARNNADWYKAIIIALIVTMSTVWLTHFGSGMVRILNPNLEGNNALLWASKNYVGNFVGAIAAAGLFAAALSSATTQVLYLALSVSRDIYDKIIVKKSGKELDEKKVIRITRIFVVVFGVISAVLSILQPGEVVQFGNLAASIFSASFFPALILGLYWRRTTKEGAATGMAGGFVSIIILTYMSEILGLPFGDYSYLPWGLHPIYFSITISFALVIIVSLATKTTPKQEEVFDIISKPGEADVLTVKDRESLKKWVYAAAIYLVVQTSVITWLATKV
jgi:Na+/proline symporter